VVQSFRNNKKRYDSHVFLGPVRNAPFFLICIVGGGIKVHSTLRPLNGLLCQPRVIMIMEKPKHSEKTCPSAALSTTNPTCCPYANPGRRGGKPASNRRATARPKEHPIVSMSIYWHFVRNSLILSL
jgi:hypothetical protein